MSESQSEAIARALQEEPPALDELSRARIEKALLAEVAKHEPVAQETGAYSPWRGVAVAVAVAAAAAAAFLPSPTREPAAPPLATMQLLREGAPIEHGPTAAGDVFETSRGERIKIQHERSRIAFAPLSRAGLRELGPDRIEVLLERGAVEVEFHPERRGEQSLGIETPHAEVEVVGTVFEVETNAARTRVEVTEGIVRVHSKTNGTTVFVRAGEEHVVDAAVALPEPPSELAEAPEAWAASATSTDAREPELESPEAAPVRLAVQGERGPGHTQRHPDASPGFDTRTAGTAQAGAGADASEALGSDASPSGAELSESAPVDSAAEDASEVAGAESDASPGGAEETAEAEAADKGEADARFALARAFALQGSHDRSRHVLYRIARASQQQDDRVRAWTMIAESYAAQRRFNAAAEAYRRAAISGGRSVGAQNAQFAFAQLKERPLRDRQGARIAYRYYLAVAPDGAHAAQARAALCRLGSRGYCR